ncbi:MAG TPA: TonB-dependent receptor [Bacteroidia bacterium]|nr:TonB-dependent receptor [Bacteroidia bacterium]
MHKLILYALLLVPIYSLGQDNALLCKFSIKGKVIDEHNNEALPFATVILKDAKLATISDSLGFFTFKNICAGRHLLVSSHLNCEDLQLEVNLVGDTEIVIKQEHHTKELHQITISANRTVAQQSLNISSIGMKELESNTGKPLGEMLKEIVGVQSLQTGNNISKPIIHGLHSNRIIIMNNGVRQEGQQWGSEHGPEIDPFVADKISVIKGAAGVRYGPDAIGGVVLIEPNSLRDSVGYDALVHLGAASNGKQGTVSGIFNGCVKQIKGLNFRVQGTLKQGGNNNTPDYFLKNTGFKEKNFSAAMAYKRTYFGSEIFYSKFNSHLGILSAAHIGNLNDLEKAFQSKLPSDTAGFSYQIQRPNQNIVHDLFKWKSYLNFNKIGKIVYTFSRQQDNRSEFDKHVPRNDSLAALNKPELNFIIHTLINELVYELQHFKKYFAQIGYMNMHQANSYDGRFFIPNFNNKGWGLFAIENYQYKKFFAELGVRYDERKQRVFLDSNGFIKQPLYSYKKYAGLIGAGYHIKGHDLKLNVGTGWRAPSVNELYANGVHHGAAAVEIGDENLIPETNVNVALWWGIKAVKKISGEAEIYQNVIQNFIYLIPVQPATQTIRGAFPTFKYMQVNAVIRGCDVHLKYQIYKTLKINLKGSYLYAINSDNNLRLTQMPQNLIEPSATWEPQLNINKWNHFYLKISYLIVAKGVSVSDDKDYLAPPHAYQLLNADAGVAFKVKKQNINLGIGISNALNTSYRAYLNRYRYFAEELGTNVILHLKIPINIKTE